MIKVGSAKALEVRYKKLFCRKNYSRIYVFFILLATTCAGVLFDHLLYRLGLTSIRLRYPFSILLSYFFFFLLIRFWLHTISMKKRVRDSSQLQWSHGGGSVDIGASTSTEKSSFIYKGAGGKSGGGGASASWTSDSSPAMTTHSPAAGNIKSSEASISLPDGDDGKAIVIVITLIVTIAGAIISGIYLIYLAPQIMADAAFQFALSFSLAKNSRQMTEPDWTGSVLKQTWKPFAFVLVASLFFGQVVHKLCPGSNRWADVELSCVKKGR